MTSANTPIPNDLSSKPKRGRGRPRKNKSTETEAVANQTDPDVIGISNEIAEMLKSVDMGAIDTNSSQLEVAGNVEKAEPATNGKRRPKRAASKKAQDTLAQLSLDALNHVNGDIEEHDDADFQLNEMEHAEDDHEDEYDVHLEDIALELTEHHDATSDDVEVPQRQAKRRGPKGQGSTIKRRKKATTISRSPSTASVSTLGKKGRIVRALKDLSAARDKIERLYGLNSDKLLRLAQIKQGFQASLFDFPAENLQEDCINNVKVTLPCCKNINLSKFENIKHTTYRTINELELGTLFAYRDDPLTVLINGMESSLPIKQRMDIPVLPNYKRFGFVHNLGGLATDMAWHASNTDDNIQYLAIALSQHCKEPLDPKLQMFNKETHVACVEVYKFVSTTLEFTKVETIVHKFGEVWDLKWHEGYSNKEKKFLGLLTFVCQDGSVKLIEVPLPNSDDDDGNLIYCEEPSLSIELPFTSITCFDFTSSETIVCGFKNGFVAEFNIFDSKIPSFYERVHDSYVITIKTAFSEFENLVVSTISVDGYFNIFEPKDIFTTMTTVNRFRGSNIAPLAYSAQLYSLILTDGADSLRAVVPRASFAMHPVCSHESTIGSISTSKLHPMVLSGAADGSLFIDNLARRLLTGSKSISKSLKSLRLWKWEYSPKLDKYSLDFNYRVFSSSSTAPSKVRIDAPGVNISCIKWNESRSAGKFYAFTNNAGLLTIEHLGDEKV